MYSGPDFVENYVTNFGAKNKVGLNSAVKGGKFIDFNALATSLLKLQVTDPGPGGNPPPSSNISYTYIYDTSGSSPTVRLTMSWNLPSVHPGARLGIFDATCKGTSVACLIQDVALPGPVGSYTFTLTRDQLVPMIADKRDPTYSLNLNMAIHYPIPSTFDKNGKPLTFKNNHGLDAVRALNVRDLDGSNSNSSLIGEITNIRSDMQYFYVQGWACFTGSNGAVSVGIQDQNGSAVPAYYSYDYDLMIPHSSPIDGYYMWYNYSNLATAPYVFPYMAMDIKVIHPDSKTNYLAGLEANPQNVLKCNTVTASHGFELIIPFWQIAQSGLGLKNFKIVGNYVNKKDSSKLVTAVLPDRDGRSVYSFPDVNFQTAVKSNLNIDRSSSNNLAIVGSICSNSPSPVEVEVSASFAEYMAGVFGDNVPHMPNAGQRPDIGDGGGNGFVADSKFTDKNSVQRYSVKVDIENSPNAVFNSLESYLTAIENGNLKTSASSTLSFKYELTDDMTNDEKNRIDYYVSKAAATAPATFNTQAYVGVNRSFFQSFTYEKSKLDQATLKRLDAVEAKISAAINAQVKLLDLRQAGTNLGLNYFNPTSSQLLVHGSQINSNNDLNNINRAPASMLTPFGPYWDYYDVGEEFSNDLIGYSFDIKKPVGAYLKATYKVDQILREVKKYEVPLSTYSVDIAHGQMIYNKAGNPQVCGSLYQHYVNPLDIPNRVGYMSDVDHFIMGFWVNGYNPLGIKAIPSADVIMQRIPLSLRFFQDGKLILHLESDYGSRMTEVRYPFQTVGYK